MALVLLEKLRMVPTEISHPITHSLPFGQVMQEEASILVNTLSLDIMTRKMIRTTLLGEESALVPANQK